MGRACDDETFGILIKETYKAFHRLRSPLLLNLASQIRFGELPWIAAVGAKRKNAWQIAAALRLGAHAMDFFPGDILPNSLVEQLNAFYDAGGRECVFICEQTADIFMGSFAPAYDEAALVAASMLEGSLYEKYYGLDYDKLRSRTEVMKRRAPRVIPWGKKTRRGALYEAVMAHSAEYGGRKGFCVVGNGMLIEHAMIYTTHNLATLVSEGARPEKPYEELAFEAFARAVGLIRRFTGPTGKLRHMKNAAYAWRQALFFLSISQSEPGDVICKAEIAARNKLGPDVVSRLFESLKIHSNGETPPKESCQPFLGWTTEIYRILGCARTI
jgi:hypothetical protein